MRQLKQYGGKALVDVSDSVDSDLKSEAEMKAWAELCVASEPLLSLIHRILGDRVTKVVLSDRLADLPCAVVTDELHGWAAGMERIMRAQGQRDSSATLVMPPSRAKTMEISSNHSIISDLRARAAISGCAEDDDRTIADTVHVLFETCTHCSPPAFPSITRPDSLPVECPPRV